jgi:hypothetical protein
MRYPLIVEAEASDARAMSPAEWECSVSGS